MTIARLFVSGQFRAYAQDNATVLELPMTIGQLTELHRQVSNAIEIMEEELKKKPEDSAGA